MYTELEQQLGCWQDLTQPATCLLVTEARNQSWVLQADMVKPLSWRLVVNPSPAFSTAVVSSLLLLDPASTGYTFKSMTQGQTSWKMTSDASLFVEDITITAEVDT
jgi:hypothetical protein